MSEAHDDLIAMLEKATGYDRKLNVLVWFEYVADLTELAAMGGYQVSPPRSSLWDEVSRCPREYGFDDDGGDDFTGSVNDALTLLPDGFGAVSMHIGEHGGSSARIGHPYVFGNAATPALAICIAAIRARTTP